MPTLNPFTILQQVQSVGKSPIHVKDSLARKPGVSFRMVLSNPPFGKKSSSSTLSSTSPSCLRSTPMALLNNELEQLLNFVGYGRLTVVLTDHFSACWMRSFPF